MRLIRRHEADRNSGAAEEAQRARRRCCRSEPTGRQRAGIDNPEVVGHVDFGGQFVDFQLRAAAILFETALSSAR